MVHPRCIYVKLTYVSDEAYAALVSERHVDSFSTYPPVVIQSSTTTSDVSGGMGILTQFNDRQFALMDSALERVRLWEAKKQAQNSTTVRVEATLG
jgi:hypothetical protein